jgi:hypothetical protein
MLLLLPPEPASVIPEFSTDEVNTLTKLWIYLTWSPLDWIKEQRIKTNLLNLCGPHDPPFIIKTPNIDPGTGTYYIGRSKTITNPKPLPVFKMQIKDDPDTIRFWFDIENRSFYNQRMLSTDPLVVNAENVNIFRKSLALTNDGPLNGEIIRAMVMGHNPMCRHEWLNDVFAGDRCVMLWRWFKNTRGGYGLLSDLIHIVAAYLAE